MINSFSNYNVISTYFLFSTKKLYFCPHIENATIVEFFWQKLSAILAPPVCTVVCTVGCALMNLKSFANMEKIIIGVSGLKSMKIQFFRLLFRRLVVIIYCFKICLLWVLAKRTELEISFCPLHLYGHWINSQNSRFFA